MLAARSECWTRRWRLCRFPRGGGDVAWDPGGNGRLAVPELTFLRKRVVELEQERRRLGRAVVTGSIPEDLAREEQSRIKTELANAERVLAVSQVISTNIEATLDLALALVGKCDEVYRRGGPRVRRYANQFFFERVLVVDGEISGAIYRAPWATMLDQGFIKQMRKNTANPGRRSCGRGLKMIALARSEGFEPPTF
jgi:site-specific DNA recombinase